MEECERYLDKTGNLEQKKTLVSIVVITYNSSRYVLETLESAKAQTYQNIELIVSDDCSTDDTIDICRNWIEENKNRFVRTELITTIVNTGISANCNRGVRSTKGEWVKLIAGDDLLTPDCVYNNIFFVESNNNIEAVFSKLKPFKGSVHSIMQNPATKDEKYSFLYSLSAKEQNKCLVNIGCFVSAPTSFLKRELFDRFGYFDERYPFMEDLPLWINLTKNEIKLHYFPFYTVFYRQGDTISSSKVSAVNMLFYKSLIGFRSQQKFSFYGKIVFSVEKLYYYVALNIFNNRKNIGTLLVRKLLGLFIRFGYLYYYCIVRMKK